MNKVYGLSQNLYDLCFVITNNHILRNYAGTA